MIVSENAKPEITEFQKLMQRTDTFLNNEARTPGVHTKEETFHRTQQGGDRLILRWDQLSWAARPRRESSQALGVL